jgi:hypothetical protein
MSHFAEINENNIVLRVLVGDNNDPKGDEGKSWFEENLGGTWIQTSFSASFRGKLACMGDIYDPELDIFYTPGSTNPEETTPIE